MSEHTSVTVVGAGGKMGMRVSTNLARTDYVVNYVETSENGRARVIAAGRPLAELVTVASSDFVILAVPDTALSAVSATVVPMMKPGAQLVTLDPAAAYAGLLTTRPDVVQVVAHPCHPSVFLVRTSPEQYEDNFGGASAPQNVVAAIDNADDAQKAGAEALIKVIYGPVIDVFWVTVKQLAILEPTLVETVACMVGGLLRDALWETVNTLGVPKEAAEAILFGHAQIALTNALLGSNPFSEACEIAMAYGRETIVKDDWRKIFDDSELDKVLARMLKLESIER